ncbi:M1 family metallopeptidase [Chondromyces crocatus]|uniref:Aminopeptidase N n=1 Tax=Chondromyces crocatus TaxID=52 RepID=A0A0K1EB10_CHOCO|nr:M1 family aminopeptidase [Chondromyces crocatus]AKT38044.1 aminopeptidase [Chondromyces crocatus]
MSKRAGVPSLLRVLKVSIGIACGGLVGCGGEETLEGPPGLAVSRAYDVVSYNLRGEFDWERGRLVATVGISLVSLEPEATRIALDSMVAEVKSVLDAEGEALSFTVDEDEGELVVELPAGRPGGGGAPLALEIAYEAASGGSLSGVPPRRGDPIGKRALYTLSEPLGASSWMPCHNQPGDRALFAVTMHMAASERMIANGALTMDEPEGEGGRRMQYVTEESLPTYLMAFAISEFEVETTMHGALPVSVWHRADVPGDHLGVLEETRRQIALFESLLGVPYPYEKYALVMLPDYSGGVEHASVSFVGEVASGQPSLLLDVTLASHELGHQWFGDLVTIASWDDLWIKEGLATLLSVEALRFHEDLSASGTLFGDTLYVASGDAVRDVSLAPQDKYTSGPYARAAWVFAQVREVLGEGAFWATLRQILEEKRHGVVSTEDVFAAFGLPLGDEAAARMRRAVDARALPTLELREAEGGGLVCTLRDPEAVLIAPIELSWHREDGSAELEVLAPGVPVTLRRHSPGDFLVVDPGDVHPSVLGFLADDESYLLYFEALVALLMPASPGRTAEFLALPGVHQVAAMRVVGLPPVLPDGFDGFKASLHAESARAASIEAACGSASVEVDPALQAAWGDTLRAALTGQRHTMGLDYVSSFAACDGLAPSRTLFAAEWSALERGLGAGEVSVMELAFLSKFALPLDDALAAWGAVALEGYSVRVRAMASAQLANYAARLAEGEVGERAVYRSVVASLLVSEASEVLRHALRAVPYVRGASKEDDAALLGGLRDVLGSATARKVHTQAVCAAHGLLSADEAGWKAFVESLAGARLAQGVRALLDDPGRCG